MDHNGGGHAYVFYSIFCMSLAMMCLVEHVLYSLQSSYHRQRQGWDQSQFVSFFGVSGDTFDRPKSLWGSQAYQKGLQDQRPQRTTQAGTRWDGKEIKHNSVTMVRTRQSVPQTYSTSVPCILRPSLQPEKYGLKLKIVLKWSDIYIENTRMMSLIAGLKIKGIVKWRGLKSEGQLYCILPVYIFHVRCKYNVCNSKVIVCVSLFLLLRPS